MFNLSETAKISYHYHSQKLKPSLGKRIELICTPNIKKKILYLKYKFWTYFVFEIFKKSTLYILYLKHKILKYFVFCILKKYFIFEI